MTADPWADAKKRHEAAMRAALELAIAGKHRFALVDVDAPTRTCEPMTDGTGRMRLSLDVWRRFTAWVPPALPSPLVYGAIALDPEELIEVRIRYAGGPTRG